MNTMTITKVAAGLFAAWLVLLLGKWAGSEIYAAESHGEPSYVIEVAETGGDSAEEEVDFTAVLASADASAGEKVFRKCSACHKAVEGDISGVTVSLGVAFNSTFVALVLSIIIMFCLHQLQLSQERLVLDCQRYADKRLLRFLVAH